ncbi:hypothetical protein H2202_010687 [Exophiala xenobiotica]|nr:hypothetical protein H2202_010687 [Exophiala xenobiotica]
MAAMDQNGINGAHTGEEELMSKLPGYHVEALWTVMHEMVPKAPQPKAIVAAWKYDELRPILLQAGESVTAEQAERRVLMLKNPALIYAGLQLILPGETAPAHRHQAFALRFIIEGSRAFTAVSGQKVTMEEGDVILTPQWQWHDHGHEGDSPMIWLDGLDLPLYHYFPTHFAQPYHEKRYPSKPIHDSPLRFPWADMQAKLDDNPDDWARSEYETRSGGHISQTLGAHAERVRAGKTGVVPRNTCSHVYHVRSGNGMTVIQPPDGREQKVQWTSRDTFAVPAWSKITHHAAEGGDAYLFVLSDRPVLDALNMYVSDEAGADKLRPT